jgi:L-aminopeptidase/D-esterase-like protein
MPVRLRARELGIPFRGSTGTWNAITDVAGVEVGYCTLLGGDERKGAAAPAVRTGVTAILPRGKNSKDPVFAGTFTLNGAGEMTGLHWVVESGFLESPIAITNTHSVGAVHEAIIEWQVRHNLMFGVFSLPLVAETFDGMLSDVNGFHVRGEHAFEALDTAAGGTIAEGNVGGGTGMCLFQWKGGSGTASRVIDAPPGRHTVGAFVQGNFGKRADAVVAGVPVGRLLDDDESLADWADFGTIVGRGSIIVVIATDAALMPHQLDRLAKRAALGIARTGGNAGNLSGDIVVAFSTANAGAARRDAASTTVEVLSNAALDPFFEAAADATEEAIVNALVAAETMAGLEGRRVASIPLDRLSDVLREHNRLSVPVIKK